MDHELPRTETALVRAHGFAALAAVLYAVLLGIAIALKFHWPDFLGDSPAWTWGRLRYGHTQGILFGWLGNAFLAFLYFAVPRLSGRTVTSRTLGWLLFAVWNFAVVVPGHILVQAGYSQPLEWAEFPIVTDAFVVLAFALMFIQFALPFFRMRMAELYVSAWYILGAIVFTLLAYPVGNFVPEVVPGARRGLQRAMDSRCRRAVRHAAGGGDRVFRHPGGDGAADLQPFPVDAGVLAAVPDLPAQRHAPLPLLVDPDGGADRRHRRIGLPRHGCGAQRHQPAAVAARAGRHGSSGRSLTVYLVQHCRVPDGQPARLVAGADAGQSFGALQRLGHRPFAFRDDRLRIVRGNRRDAARLAAHAGPALQHARLRAGRSGCWPLGWC